MPACKGTEIVTWPVASVLNACSLTKAAGCQVFGSEASGWDWLVVEPPDEVVARPTGSE